MADPKDLDAEMEDDYDEEADGDFESENASEEIISSSSEGDDKVQDALSTKQGRAKAKPKPRTKAKQQPELLELDSGDEATIQELKKLSRKKKARFDNGQGSGSDVEEPGWRVRTRAMREKDQVELKKSRLASVRGSTIDVDQMWKIMNNPGGLDDVLKPTTSPVVEGVAGSLKENNEPSEPGPAGSSSRAAEMNRLADEQLDEMVTIDETYEFAGQTHTRKKTVPRSSAEAKLWLSQKSLLNTDSRFMGEEPIKRPLRRISRFDPNLNNLDSFKKSWERSTTDGRIHKAHKLNMVEKSKMDWAAHVDQEGLQDELIEHAKAKGGYLGRMDFLGEVEQRKEEEARRVRLKG